MKCRKCGKEAVGVIEHIGFSKGGLFMPHTYKIFEGVCEEHLKEEIERLKNL